MLDHWKCESYSHHQFGSWRLSVVGACDVFVFVPVVAPLCVSFCFYVELNPNPSFCDCD